MLLALAVGAGAALAAESPIVPAGKSDKGYATGDMVLGRSDAPLTLIEYASMTCPHCAQFHAEDLPTLKSGYIDTGKLRVVFREFPLDGFALRGAMLARCAGPERFFSFVDVLFKSQRAWAAKPKDGADPLSELQKLAKLGGIGEEQFKSCMADQALADEITARRLDGEKIHQIRATPGFVLNGKTLEGTRPIDAVVAALGGAPGAAAPAAAPADRTMYWIAGGVAVLIVLAGGAFWWSRRDRGAKRA